MTIHPVILLVTDDPVTDKIIRTNLSVRYYDILTVGHVSDAVEEVAKGGCDVDLVLLDVTVPASKIRDELAGCKEIRRVSQIPIIVLSTSSAESYRRRAIRSGASAYLNKPFGVDYLVSEVRRLLRKSDTGGGSLD
jgi:two-component system OmpR family response regulator